MLAVGGTSCISLISVAAADENSLTPLHRLLPAETASLGFGGSPVGGGNKNSCFAFFRHFCVGGGITTLRPLWLCRNNPARGCFSRKNGFLRVGALRRRTRRSLLHTVLFWYLYAGWYHYPRRALHAVETLDARGSRRRIHRFYAVSEFALCGLNIPSSGTHATPAPNRAHSGSHAETRGESAERRMQGCKVFKSLHPYILAPVNTSTIARRIFLK